MSKRQAQGRLPRGVGPVLAAGAVAAVAYAMWPETPPTAVAPPAAPGATTPVQASRSLLPGPEAPVSEWVRAANTLMDQGQYTQAIEGYTHALHIDSSDAAVWVDRGACLHAVGNLKAAEADFRRALRLVPEHTTAHFNLGIVFLTAGQLDSARPHFSYVQNAAPGSPEAARAKSILEGAAAKP